MQAKHARFMTVVALLHAAPAAADIAGFNDLSGWTYTQADGGSPATLPDADTIQLTSLGTDQARGVFYNTAQDITQFTVSFTYRAANASIFGCEYGAAFVLQRQGPGVVGATGGGLGYGGIGQSAAVTLQLRSNTSGFYSGGSIGGGSPSVDPVVLVSANEIEVTLAYNGVVLTQTMRDTVTGDQYQRSHIVGDLSALIGGDTAYIGFTASTTTGQCSGNAAEQYFSGFRFTTVPGPGVAGVLGAFLLVKARRRR